MLDKNESNNLISFFINFIEGFRNNDYGLLFFFVTKMIIWEKDKIEKAIEKIEEEKEEKCIGYCSNLKLVDENLTFMKICHIREF